MTEKTDKVPEYKKKIVEELKNLAKGHKTILIASIKNLPGSQFQEICKKLRGKAIVKVPKKNLIFRAIEDNKDPEMKKIEQNIENSVAILFSDLDAFELAADLIKKKSPAKAKPGQEAPEDIVVKAGPTDLVPGPAISELGAVGIQIQIKEGKIEIKADKVIAKKGDKISQAASDIMGKLGIKPFSIGFIPLVAYDTKENKFYSEMNIDTEGTLKELKEAYGRALPFAINRNYVSADTIKYLLQKAERNAMALEKLKPIEETPKEEILGKVEEKIEETQTPEENKSEGEGK